MIFSRPQGENGVSALTVDSRQTKKDSAGLARSSVLARQRVLYDQLRHIRSGDGADWVKAIEIRGSFC